jgi:hypothetical protein
VWTIELHRSDGRLLEQQMNLPDLALQKWLENYAPHSGELVLIFNDDPHQPLLGHRNSDSTLHRYAGVAGWHGAVVFALLITWSWHSRITSSAMG